MSNSAPARINRGAYETPFSGVGIEYYPLGGKLDHTGILIHEVGYIPDATDWFFPNVFSPFWRLYYFSKPGHFLKFKDGLHALTPDWIFLIPDHVCFHCRGADPVPQFWLQFSMDKSVSPRQPIPIRVQPSASDLSLIHDLQRMILNNPDFTPTESIYRYSLALLNVVISRADIEWRKPLPPELTDLIAFIHSHLSEPLTNQRLADRACLSIEGLSKAFRSRLGISPAAYVTQCRIKEASQMLLQGADSIDQIALRTGFANRHYFSRIFKKLTGESPARFRRLHGKTGAPSLSYRP
jgi:AraC family transcriptional regulator of arabinose operon